LTLRIRKNPYRYRKSIVKSSVLLASSKKLIAHLVLISACCTSAALAETGVTDTTITLAQTTALSGPLGDLGQESLKGAKVYFDGVNARGGIHGRSIRLVTKDDAYNTKTTLDNLTAIIDEDASFALFGTFGTPNNEALIPVAQKAGLPLIAPYTGAPSIRSPSSKGVFNIRASYADEVDKLVTHLATLGIKRIAIAYLNNGFGKEVLAAATASLDRLKLKPLIAVSVESNASDATSATETLLASQPEAVLLALAGKPTIEVIRAVSQQRKGMQMYALSVLATPSNLKALGPDGTGVAISQVVPFPNASQMPLVREYQTAMVAAGFNDFSHVSLEGYINAKLMTEGLRRVGRNLTRAGLVSALNDMRNYNLGGIELSFGQGAASGSRFVELTMINGQGKLIK
jgi:branched-chain amino acid transport system substrate-binding protein